MGKHKKVYEEIEKFVDVVWSRPMSKDSLLSDVQKLAQYVDAVAYSRGYAAALRGEKLKHFKKCTWCGIRVYKPIGKDIHTECAKTKNRVLEAQAGVGRGREHGTTRHDSEVDAQEQFKKFLEEKV
jgi:hypothetical protein